MKNLSIMDEIIKTAELFLRVVAVMVIIAPVVWWFISPRFEPILAIPLDIKVLTEEVAGLRAQFNGVIAEAVEIRGRGIIISDNDTVPGSTVKVTYVLRRNINCDTDIIVRFFSYQYNTVDARYTQVIPAVKSPVSKDFSPFTVTVQLPDNIEPGWYSYFPIIRPKDCGVYGDVVPTLSDPFLVVKKPN